MDDDLDDAVDDDFDDFDIESPADPDELRLLAERDLKAFQAARIDFRLSAGGYVQPSLAAVVDAAFLLIDPAGTQQLVGDPKAPGHYDPVASRIWHRLVIEFVAADLIARFGEGTSEDDDHDLEVSVDFAEVLEIVEEELRAEYSTPETAVSDDDREFARLVGAEFDAEVPAPLTCAPAAALDIARLIHRRAGSYTIRRGAAD